MVKEGTYHRTGERAKRVSQSHASDWKTRQLCSNMLECLPLNSTRQSRENILQFSLLINCSVSWITPAPSAAWMLPWVSTKSHCLTKLLISAQWQLLKVVPDFFVCRSDWSLYQEENLKTMSDLFGDLPGVVCLSAMLVLREFSVWWKTPKKLNKTN